MEFFAGAEHVLVIPCWGGRGLRQSCGPPVIAPVMSLADLAAHIPPRRGVALIDVFGHEGAYNAELFQDLLLVGDNGSIASISYAASGWQAPRVASVGPRITSTLLAYLENTDTDVDDADELAAWRVGRIEGSNEQRRAAIGFLKRLGAVGDDRWRRLDRRRAITSPQATRS